MTRCSTAAALAAILVGAAPGAGAADGPAPLRITIAPGQTLRDALRISRQEATRTRLRRAWIESGQSLPRDTTAPAITSGSVISRSIDVTTPPVAPEVKVSYTTGSAGLSVIYLYFYSQTSQQEVTVAYAPTYVAPPTKSGTVTVQNLGQSFYYFSPLGLYSAAGLWTLEYAYLYDNSGNVTSYDNSQLRGIFSTNSFKVQNTVAQDTTPPTVTAGTIITPTISATASYPVFKTKLTVADNLSGVIQTDVFLQPPGANYGSSLYNLLSHPMTAGTATNYENLADIAGSPVPTGTWTIQGYGACDAAGNCLDDLNPADVQILFGTTTFTVTP